MNLRLMLMYGGGPIMRPGLHKTSVKKFLMELESQMQKTSLEVSCERMAKPKGEHWKAKVLQNGNLINDTFKSLTCTLSWLCCRFRMVDGVKIIDVQR